MRTPGRAVPIRATVSLGMAMAPAMIALAATSAAARDRNDAAAEVAALDTRYQAAVKANDAATMDRILAADFVLVNSSGQTFTRDDLIGAARTEDYVYEHQEEVAGTQTVRVFGNRTAVVTAQLWEKGTSRDGSTFDDHLWFSDTYVRRQGTWEYVLGQAAGAL